MRVRATFLAAVTVALCAAGSVGAAPVTVSLPLDLKNGTGPRSNKTAANASDTCFLNRFRTISPKQATQQGINITRTAHFNIGSTVFDLVLMGVGLVFLFAGTHVTTFVLFVTGAATGMGACFFATSNIFSAVGFFNCWVLGIVPLVGGLLLGVIVLKLLQVAFFAIGASTGGILGYYIYVLFLSHLHTKVIFMHQDATFWLALVVPGLIFGFMTLRLESAIIAMATALLGSFAFMIGFQYEVLSRVDHRFRPSPHIKDYEDGNYYHSPYVYGPIIGSLVLAIIGIAVQLRTKKSKKPEGTDEERRPLYEERAWEREPSIFNHYR